jgi:AraC-like DNA-binding protein
MLYSSVSYYTDIDRLRCALQPVNNEIVITGTGPFSARVVTINLPRLRLQRVDETLARAWHVHMAHSRVAIGFSASPGPSMRCQGVVLGPDDLALFSPTQPVWHAISGPSQFAIMSLPKNELTELGVALAGQPLMPPDTMTTQVPPKWTKRLQSMHAAAIHLAEESPEIIADPEATRGLEASLIDAMIACLASGRMRTDTLSQRRRTLIIKRFRELEEANRDRTLYLTEVCKAIGVSQRTLNDICQDVLGASPKRYLFLRRLHLAHRELRESVPSRGQVTQIATKYGFWELGRFAVAYRSVFGGLPSVTLSRQASCWPERTDDLFLQRKAL